MFALEDTVTGRRYGGCRVSDDGAVVVLLDKAEDGGMKKGSSAEIEKELQKMQALGIDVDNFAMVRITEGDMYE